MIHIVIHKLAFSKQYISYQKHFSQETALERLM